MVSTCANPECSASFHRLQEGRLFVVHIRDFDHNASMPEHRELFWLCPNCANQFTVIVGPGTNVTCVPLRRESEAEIGTGFLGQHVLEHKVAFRR